MAERFMLLHLILTWLVLDCYAQILAPLPTDQTVEVGKNVDILWSYGNVADAILVEWKFTADSSATEILIMDQVPPSPPTVKSFNCMYNNAKNGGITITNVTTANTGTYRITVVYISTSAEETIKVTVKDCSCKCVCEDCKICHILSAITIPIKTVLIIVAICLIVHGRIERFGQPVCHGLNWFDIIFIVIDVFCTTYGVVAAVVSLIVLYVKNCTDCPCDCNGSCSCNDCKACLGLPITALILAALINTILIIILIYKRRGDCSQPRK